MEGGVGLGGVAVGEAHAGVDGDGELDGGYVAVAVDGGAGLGGGVEGAEGDDAEDAGVSVASVAGEVDSVDGSAAGVVRDAVGLVVVDLEARAWPQGTSREPEVVHGFSVAASSCCAAFAGSFRPEVGGHGGR